MNSELSKLASKIVNPIQLWAKESLLRTIIVTLLLLIFGVPLIQYLQSLVRLFPYKDFARATSEFTGKNFRPLDDIILLIFIMVGGLIYFLYTQISKMRRIKENFSRGLSMWNIPLNAGWTTQETEDANGRVLSVTNSSYPGTLKEAYSWYDYEVSFFTKIDKDVPEERQNFSVFVRAESNLNGIMLQVTKTHLNPHLLYEGDYILDNDKFEQLPTVLKTDSWIPVKIVVRGNSVELKIQDYRLEYKIPTLVYKVEEKILGKGKGKSITLNELKRSNEKIEGIQKKFVDLMDQLDKTSSEPEKDRLEKESDEAFKVFRNTPFVRITIEFQKGSIGFRESGAEHAYFRKLRIKKL